MGLLPPQTITWEYVQKQQQQEYEDVERAVAVLSLDSKLVMAEGSIKLDIKENEFYSKVAPSPLQNVLRVLKKLAPSVVGRYNCREMN